MKRLKINYIYGTFEKTFDGLSNFTKGTDLAEMFVGDYEVGVRYLKDRDCELEVYYKGGSVKEVATLSDEKSLKQNVRSIIVELEKDCLFEGEPRLECPSSNFYDNYDDIMFNMVEPNKTYFLVDDKSLGKIRINSNSSSKLRLEFGGKYPKSIMLKNSEIEKLSGPPSFYNFMIKTVTKELFDSLSEGEESPSTLNSFSARQRHDAIVNPEISNEGKSNFREGVSATATSAPSDVTQLRTENLTLIYGLGSFYRTKEAINKFNYSAEQVLIYCPELKLVVRSRVCGCVCNLVYDLLEDSIVTTELGFIELDTEEGLKDILVEIVMNRLKSRRSPALSKSNILNILK